MKCKFYRVEGNKMLSNKTFSLPLKMSTILFMLFFVASVNLPAQTDYIVSEGHIVGDFEGWDGETLFEMSDGTFWIQAEYSYIYYYAYNPKAIVFKRGPNYYLKVERVRKILKVLPVDNVIKSRIDGDFKGFEGNTIYKLTNGTVWQQTDGKYQYKYAYSPRVVIYRVGFGWKMSVEGITVSVERLE